MAADALTTEEQFTRRRLAAIRDRMAAALAGDDEALKVLDGVFPADWGDAPIAVVWMLGNAARFATETNGLGSEFAQAWLDRLVDPEGNPLS
jgi:hypothetical protein